MEAVVAGDELAKAAEDLTAVVGLGDAGADRTISVTGQYVTPSP